MRTRIERRPSGSHSCAFGRVFHYSGTGESVRSVLARRLASRSGGLRGCFRAIRQLLRVRLAARPFQTLESCRDLCDSAQSYFTSTEPQTERRRSGRRRKRLTCLCWGDFFFSYFVVIRTFCFCAVVCCPLQAAGKRFAQEIDRDPPSSLLQHFVSFVFFFRECKPTTEIEPQGALC